MPFISLNFDTKERENAKKKKITTKHRMFKAKNLGQPRKLTQLLVVIVEAFRRSGLNMAKLGYTYIGLA